MVEREKKNKIAKPERKMQIGTLACRQSLELMIIECFTDPKLSKYIVTRIKFWPKRKQHI